MNFKAGSIQM